MKNISTQKQVLFSIILGLFAVGNSAYAQVDVSEVVSVLAAIGVGLGAIFVALVATKGAMIAAPWILSMMGKK